MVRDDGPLHRQRRRLIRDGIGAEAVGGGDAIPPARDVAGDDAGSLLTVREAIGGPVAERLPARRRGMGTSVAGGGEKSFSRGPAAALTCLPASMRSPATERRSRRSSTTRHRRSRLGRGSSWRCGRGREGRWRRPSPIEPLAAVSQMFVVGRGYGLGIARAHAPKLKETCAIRAEPFSTAEVGHGPMTIVGPGFPVLALVTSDAAGDDVVATGAAFAARGAVPLLACAGGTGLPVETGHPAIEPILILTGFYGLVEQPSRAHGRDPDRPPFVSKAARA